MDLGSWLRSVFSKVSNRANETYYVSLFWKVSKRTPCMPVVRWKPGDPLIPAKRYRFQGFRCVWPGPAPHSQFSFNELPEVVVVTRDSAVMPTATSDRTLNLAYEVNDVGRGSMVLCSATDVPHMSVVKPQALVAHWPEVVRPMTEPSMSQMEAELAAMGLPPTCIAKVESLLSPCHMLAELLLKGRVILDVEGAPSAEGNRAAWYRMFLAPPPPLPEIPVTSLVYNRRE
ncbi:protein ORF17 [Anguillid herpesvirus 1]|uniref:Protein ORF17 n=1 Tax=Anguillid herpesvirus 1 TaxID=150286 RepID=A0A1J0REE2_9VIRU|nr:protein ORF17 [Anguillid herpesvirus 1]ADA57780.1 protein ORF17 [Anguillid herpesvirus 1]APD76180.1 ORF17 [Anguillid herpesvirus 1]QRM16312.1 protein ORF17 [Anguillid herpesvirus 1]QRM16442.1 protein ORF17 [Anguillid herpesvirus 1]QRM16571.1 protein ORF17 [Anguillid herpesvirus 1]